MSSETQGKNCLRTTLATLALLPLLLVATEADGRAPGPRLEEVRASGDVDTGVTEQPACSSEWLRDGELLPDLPGLYVRWSEERAWGTPQMVDTIIGAAEEMAWLFPDADPLVIGDISLRGGGFFYGHKSHRGGVDADIGIYHDQGRQHQSAFVDLTPSTFDFEANWALIRSLLETGNVDRILLDRSLILAMRSWLAVDGRLPQAQIDAIFPEPGTAGIYAMRGVVQHATGHRNHLHVRVLCADGQQAR